MICVCYLDFCTMIQHQRTFDYNTFPQLKYKSAAAPSISTVQIQICSQSFVLTL